MTMYSAGAAADLDEENWSEAAVLSNHYSAQTGRPPITNPDCFNVCYSRNHHPLRTTGHSPFNTCTNTTQKKITLRVSPLFNLARDAPMSSPIRHGRPVLEVDQMPNSCRTPAGNISLKLPLSSADQPTGRKNRKRRSARSQNQSSSCSPDSAKPLSSETNKSVVDIDNNYQNELLNVLVADDQSFEDLPIKLFSSHLLSKPKNKSQTQHSSRKKPPVRVLTSQPNVPDAAPTESHTDAAEKQQQQQQQQMTHTRATIPSNGRSPPVQSQITVVQCEQIPPVVQTGQFSPKLSTATAAGTAEVRVFSARQFPVPALNSQRSYTTARSSCAASVQPSTHPYLSSGNTYRSVADVDDDIRKYEYESQEAFFRHEGFRYAQSNGVRPLPAIPLAVPQHLSALPPVIVQQCHDVIPLLRRPDGATHKRAHSYGGENRLQKNIMSTEPKLMCQNTPSPESYQNRIPLLDQPARLGEPSTGKTTGRPSQRAARLSPRTSRCVTDGMYSELIFASERTVAPTVGPTTMNTVTALPSKKELLMSNRVSRRPIIGPSIVPETDRKSVRTATEPRQKQDGRNASCCPFCHNSIPETYFDATSTTVDSDSPMQKGDTYEPHTATESLIHTLNPNRAEPSPTPIHPPGEPDTKQSDTHTSINLERDLIKMTKQSQIICHDGSNSAENPNSNTISTPTQVGAVLARVPPLRLPPVGENATFKNSGGSGTNVLSMDRRSIDQDCHAREAQAVPVPEVLDRSGSGGSTTKGDSQVAKRHVIFLDADDTLIPTSEFCEEKYLDQEPECLPESFRDHLKLLDEQLTALFDQLHSIIVAETLPSPLSTGANESGDENFLFSVLIVTNATLSHIQTTFEKFLPKLTEFFQSRNVKLSELVCSARDLWCEEFPFEHFYDFWKAWTLEEILRELQLDGIEAVTVFSIGDDEPERRATAYVACELSEMVKGTKILKITPQLKLPDLTSQLKFLTENVRRYIAMPNSFDIRLEQSFESVGTNGESCGMAEEGGTGGFPPILELEQAEPPEIPDKVEALFTQFELKYALLCQTMLSLDRSDVTDLVDSLSVLNDLRSQELETFVQECREFLKVYRNHTVSIGAEEGVENEQDDLNGSSSSSSLSPGLVEVSQASKVSDEKLVALLNRYAAREELSSLSGLSVSVPVGEELLVESGGIVKESGEKMMKGSLDVGPFLAAIQNTVKFLLQYPNLVRTLPDIDAETPSRKASVVLAVELLLEALACQQPQLID